MPPAPLTGLETPVLLITRAEGTWSGALSVEEIVDVDAIQEKSVAGVTLSIRPNGGIARGPRWCRFPQRARALTPVRLCRKTGKTSCRQRCGVNLRRVHHVSVGRVNGVHQRRCFYFNRRRCFANLQRCIHRGRAVCLNGDVLRLLQIETVCRVSECVDADREIDEVVCARSVRDSRSRQGCCLRRHCHRGVGNFSPCWVSHLTCDAAQGLL